MIYQNGFCAIKGHYSSDTLVLVRSIIHAIKLLLVITSDVML